MSIEGFHKEQADDLGSHAHIRVGLVETSIARELMPGTEFDHHPQLIGILTNEQRIVAAVRIPVEIGRIAGQNEIDWGARITFAREQFEKLNTA